MASRGSLILVLLVVLIGCRPATPPPASLEETQSAPESNGSTSSPGQSTSVPDQVQELRNVQYQPGAADTLQVVQLTDGNFEQGTPGSDGFMSIFLTEHVAMGDLNGDGTEEAAALISENYGGTGVFVFLAVYSQVGGAWTFQTSTIASYGPIA